jgi:hypothetical protein
MPIKMTLREAIAVKGALLALPKTINLKAGHALARIRDKLTPELRRASEQELKLIETHGGKVDGNKITWPDEIEPADYAREWSEYIDEEVEIDRDPVKLDVVLGPNPEKYPAIDIEVLSVLAKVIVE